MHGIFFCPRSVIFVDNLVRNSEYCWGVVQIVRYVKHFHHVTLDTFDICFHHWLYLYNMRRRGVRFDRIYDEIDALLV